MNKNISKLLMILFTVLLSNIQNSYDQKHSFTSVHTSYTGLSMAGYQGWFGTPNNGGTNSWCHYHGAKAVKISYVEPSLDLADRSLDNWDSKMALTPGAEYFCKFWAKTDNPGVGKVNVTYGFFDGIRNVISEAGVWFDVTNEYKEYEFKFTAPAGTVTSWLAFRWKDQTADKFLPAVLYFDHIQLLTEDKTVGVKNIALDLSEGPELKQNYPNPFSASTTISYVLPENSMIQLSIYNIYGQKVADLVNQEMNAGTHEVIWNGRNLVGGI